MMNICVITPVYPMNGFLERGSFLATLVAEWTECDVAVIAPIPLSVYLKSLSNRSEDFVAPPANILITPIFLSFSRFLPNLNKRFFLQSVVHGAKKLKTPDLYYGKFLLSGVHAAVYLGERYSRPVIADLGESQLLENMNIEEKENAKKLVKKLTGAVVVSERLKNEIIELGMPSEKILLLPNAIDKNKFKKMDKQECRMQLSLPQDKFLVVFVGHFIERKGPLRVLRAIEKLNNDKIKAIFLGKGSQIPIGLDVLKASSVNNSELGLWLNASDVFVLPTLSEGNCNAINEAMACGLPIISSDIEDVKPQVNIKNSILIDPHNSDDISSAIEKIYSNPELQYSMSKESMRLTEELSISTRANKILKWMEEFVNATKS